MTKNNLTSLNSVKNNTQNPVAEDSNLIARDIPYSGKAPYEKRSNQDEEKSRLEAINIVKNNSSDIIREAKKNKITPESIAGAILWEGIENSRAGSIPGKIHSSEAKKLYVEGRVPRDYTTDRLKEPKVAIAYIAAFMNYAAETYERVAGVNIRNNSGVLTTLYHGGKVLERAQKLRDRRAADASNSRKLTEPGVPKKEMGEFTNDYEPFIREWLGITRNYGPYGMNNSTDNVSNNGIPSSTSSGNNLKITSSTEQQHIAKKIQRSDVNSTASSTVDINNTVYSTTNSVGYPSSTKSNTELSKVVTLLKDNAAEVKKQYGLDVTTNEGLGRAVMQYWKENNLDLKTLREQLSGLNDSEFETASRATANINTTQATETEQRAM